MITDSTHSPSNHSPSSPLHWNRDLVLLLGATFLAYSNISVFYQFYEYLQTLSIDPKWFGLLMGIFSGISLLVRPVISSFFHFYNSRRYLLLGIVIVTGALMSYSLTVGFWSVLVVRALHGLGFAILGTALMAIMVHYIPKDRSAQAFGYLAIIVLIPNTMVPPLLPFLTTTMGNFPAVLMLFAGITVLVLPLVLGLGRPVSEDDNLIHSDPLQIREIVANLKDLRITGILAAMLFLYSTHALVFFFLDGYGRSLGIKNTGYFLSLALFSEIGIRLVAGRFFDRLPKHRVLGVTMVGLAASYAALANIGDTMGFMIIGVFVGLGWGVAMPVFNGLMFDASSNKFRSFNVNLGLQMFQAGLFLGPFIGAPVTAAWGFITLFYLCVFLSLLSAALVVCLGGGKKP